jgi:hypothetical protein
LNQFRVSGRSTLVLAVGWILAHCAVACGGEGADPDGAAPVTSVARGSGGEDLAAPTIGCTLFPDDNYWHADVSRLPVLPKSDTYIGSIGRNTPLKADFGAGVYDGFWIGIPYTVVDGGQPGVGVAFRYDEESDAVPYPIPANAPVKGGPGFVRDSDRHVLVVERNSCDLYELYKAKAQSDGTWKADSGAVFDLQSNDLRPDTFTSADAAGLHILPGLVRYDEVASGEIDHAIRSTVEKTRDEYVWPARHQAGQLAPTRRPWACGCASRVTSTPPATPRSFR